MKNSGFKVFMTVNMTMPAAITNPPFRNQPGHFMEISKNPRRNVAENPSTAVLPPVIKALITSITANRKYMGPLYRLENPNNFFGGRKKLVARKKDSATRKNEYCAVNEKVDATLKYPPAENPSNDSPPTLKFNQCDAGSAF